MRSPGPWWRRVRRSSGSCIAAGSSPARRRNVGIPQNARLPGNGSRWRSPCEVAAARVSGERGERPEGEQVAHAVERAGVADGERGRPRRQGFGPRRLRMVRSGGEDAEAERGESAPSSARPRRTPRAAGGQKNAIASPSPAPDRGGEAAPERALRAVLAGAEQRPAHPPLVVLGAREGEREQASRSARGGGARRPRRAPAASTGCRRGCGRRWPRIRCSSRP